MQHTMNEILPSRNEISHRYRGMSLERVRIMETLITKFVRRQGRVTHIFRKFCARKMGNVRGGPLRAPPFASVAPRDFWATCHKRPRTSP